MPRLRLSVVLLVVAAACGPADDVPLAQPAPTTTLTAVTATVPPVAAPVLGAPLVTEPFVPPPPLHVRGGGTDTVLGLWSWCWSSGNANACADGHPPEVPADIGAPPDLEVAFDTPGWRFSATFVPTGQECGGRAQSMPLTAIGPTTHRLIPVGRAGDYTVTLSGRSAAGSTNRGDVATTFRWHTPTNGPNEAPSATMSLLASPPEAKVSLGAELSATALGVTTRPGTVEASAVVTASSGASMKVVFRPIEIDCVPEGSFFLRSDGDDGKAVAMLGPAPFRYDVALVLGGITYRGTGVWPNDVVHDCSPCTTLAFVPPLPAL